MLERGTIGPQSATYNPRLLLQLEPLFEFRDPCDEGVKRVKVVPVSTER